VGKGSVYVEHLACRRQTGAFKGQNVCRSRITSNYVRVEAALLTQQVIQVDCSLVIHYTHNTCLFNFPAVYGKGQAAKLGRQELRFEYKAIGQAFGLFGFQVRVTGTLAGNTITGSTL